jgi:hypothetical protein
MPYAFIIKTTSHYYSTQHTFSFPFFYHSFQTFSSSFQLTYKPCLCVHPSICFTSQITCQVNLVLIHMISLKLFFFYLLFSYFFFHHLHFVWFNGHSSDTCQTHKIFQNNVIQVKSSTDKPPSQWSCQQRFYNILHLVTILLTSKKFSTVNPELSSKSEFWPRCPTSVADKCIRSEAFADTQWNLLGRSDMLKLQCSTH